MGRNQNREIAQQIGSLKIAFPRLDVGALQAILYLKGEYDGVFDKVIIYPVRGFGRRLGELKEVVRPLPLRPDPAKKLSQNFRRVSMNASNSQRIVGAADYRPGRPGGAWR